MSPDLILILALVIGIPIVIAILFKTLWRVPRADEALIITGFGVKGAPARRAEIELGPDGQPTPQGVAAGKTFRIITGGGAFVVPVLQRRSTSPCARTPPSSRSPASTSRRS